jgi:hypothetical protein
VTFPPAVAVPKVSPLSVSTTVVLALIWDPPTVTVI